MLIDGDNAQPSLIGNVLAEAAKHGEVTTRRVYGNWATPNMAGWKNVLNQHAIQPMQQFPYSKGKNATDIALIIDAMDLLHSGRVDGFCIVSSDSDFVRLATRIREQRMFVMGVGRATTPESFRNACSVFVMTENLTPEEMEQDQDEESASAEARQSPNEKPPPEEAEQDQGKRSTPEEPKQSQNEGSPKPDWVPQVNRAIEETAQEDGWAHLGAVGNYLRKLDPGFDPRTYGHKQLSQLIGTREDLFELRQSGKGGEAVVYARLRGT